MYVDSYANVLNRIAQMGVYASPFINISEAEELNCVEFDFYLKVFEDKFEKEMENRNELIKNAFGMAKNCTEAICKTIAGAWGGNKKGNSSKK
jgi:hypothetical protein